MQCKNRSQAFFKVALEPDVGKLLTYTKYSGVGDEEQKKV